MPSAEGVRMAGFGHYLPDRRIENAEIETRLGLEPGWILARTGIRARHYAEPDQALSDLAIPAGAMALCGFEPGQVGLLLLATSTPDHLLPPTAPLVAASLGLACGALDVAGACTGFVQALILGAGHVRATGKGCLVIGANLLSRRIQANDPGTSALFADAAGAVLLAPSDDPADGLLACDLGSDGAAHAAIRIPRGGSRLSWAPGETEGLTMEMPDGRTVFLRAVEAMERSACKVLSEARMTAADVTAWAPHQANGRILSALRERLDLRHAAQIGSLADHGNSSAATIPLGLSLHHDAGEGLEGVLLMSSFGAGLLWASALWKQAA